ncbi:WD40/YVTN/BNR-like repeat-containing protein [Chryseolinea lacunae]|uniref:Exo-alpha-sialidase n=1 Tax=Chryseolinea lacunae TaxID=2801331 RepID=A0ABS1KZ85_9BACT|nr:exo-alpha-sialidase [Chryseolinea lacunae]MBL0744650.1 exo-alpha-sialidase [Chryseolinea lacunae]
MKIYSLAFFCLFQFSFVCQEALKVTTSSPITESLQKLDINRPGAMNIVFKSTDGGQTWQDISEGLPEAGQEEDGIYRDVFFADERGLFLSAGDWIYHNKPNSKAPFWSKEISLDEHRSIAPAGKTGIFAYNYNEGQFVRSINGTSVWTSAYTNLQAKEVRTVFETAGGTVFVGTNNGILKSTNGGKSWKPVHGGGWVMKFVESNGVLMATSAKGIIRSTDDGENWELVISEGGVGIAIENVKGGFAAITFNTVSETRRVRTSYDGGKSWNPIDAGLPPSLSIASIVQVDEYLFCGHPTGIFRSSDKGKTWKLLLPSIENKVFNLRVSGNVIYAIPRAGGC